MECRICGTNLVGIERACPSCFAYIEREVPQPRREQVPQPVSSQEGSAAVAPGAGLELAAELAGVPATAAELVGVADPAEGSARCPAHPDRSIAGVCSRCGTFLCRECEPRIEQPSARCAACRAREENEELEGIGGWLLLPALGCVLHPLAFGFLSILLLQRMNVETSDALIVRACFTLGMCLFATVVSVCFFLKKRFVPGLMIAELVLSFMAALVSNATSEGLLRAAIPLAIWAPYFLVSRRVKRTFVR